MRQNSAIKLTSHKQMINIFLVTTMTPEKTSQHRPQKETNNRLLRQSTLRLELDSNPTYFQHHPAR